MAKDKKNGADRKVPTVPDEIKQLLVAASRPPQKIETKADARSDVLMAFAETIAIGFQVIGGIAQHVSSAPHYPSTESRQ